jgi:hypothetical protein
MVMPADSCGDAVLLLPTGDSACKKMMSNAAGVAAWP